MVLGAGMKLKGSGCQHDQLGAQYVSHDAGGGIRDTSLMLHFGNFLRSERSGGSKWLLYKPYKQPPRIFL